DPRRAPDAPSRHQGPPEGGRPPRPQAGAERLAAVAALPAPTAPGRGAAPAAGPPRPAPSPQKPPPPGRGPPDPPPGPPRPSRTAEPGRGTGAHPAPPGLAHRPPDHRTGRQSRGGRDQPDPGRRAGHLLDLPGLPVPHPQAGRARAGLPRLPVHRPPRPVR